MSNVSQNRMIVGLDIGTSKVVAIVGEVSPEGKLEIVGIGSHGSKGLKKGVVVNMLASPVVTFGVWALMASLLFAMAKSISRT